MIIWVRFNAFSLSLIEALFVFALFYKNRSFHIRRIKWLLTFIFVIGATYIFFTTLALGSTYGGSIHLVFLAPLPFFYLDARDTKILWFCEAVLTVLLIASFIYNYSNPGLTAIPSELKLATHISITLVEFTGLIITIFFFWRQSFRTERELEYIATHDSLTGLMNRRKFKEMFHIAFMQMQRYNIPVSFVIFDIDWFKKLNDEYGHLEGDRALKELARLLHANLRSTDSFGRWGGEEFTILFVNTRGPEARKIADKLRKLVEKHRFGAKQLRITISMGVTEVGPEDTLSSVLKRADDALYLSKSKGKNKVTLV